MSRRAQENVVAVALLLLFTGLLIASFRYGPRARLVPVPIATLGIILTLMQIGWQNLRSADDLQIDALELFSGRTSKKRRDESDQAAEPQIRPLRKEAAAFGIVALLLAFFWVVGPLPSIFIFCAGYFIRSRHFSWGIGLAWAALATGVLYLLFGQLLNVQLNRGLLAPLITQYILF